MLLGLALPALALAGAPFTGGFLAKAGLKQALAGLAAPWPDLLPPLLMSGAFGTALLMARLFWLARGVDAHRSNAHPGDREPTVAWGFLLAAGVAVPWVLAMPTWRAASLGPEAAAAFGAFAGALMAWMLASRLGWRAPDWPAGDLLIVCERICARLISYITERGRS